MSTATSICRIAHLVFICLWLSGSVQASDPNTRLLNEILSYVNRSEAACNDYFKYACGKWGEKHVNDSYIEITGLIEQKVNEDLVRLMVEQEQRRPLPATSVEAKVLSFYKSCRQATKSEQSGKRYLRLLPPNEQITWPQLKSRSEHWASSKFHWLETLARLRRYGLNNVFFGVDAVPHLNNSTKYVISISKLNFEQSNQRFHSYLLTKLQLRVLGVAAIKSSLLAPGVINLDSALSELVEEETEQPEELSLQQLERLSGGQWRKYLETLLGHSVSSDYALKVENSAHLSAVVQLINGWDCEAVASYIMLRLVEHLHKDIMDSVDDMQCVLEVRRYMELAVGLLYEERFIGPNKLQQHRADVSELFELLRKQFLKQLDENYARLAHSDLEMLRAKLLNMTVNIGNMPQRADRRNYVQGFYADLELVENDYAVNNLRLLEFQTRRWLEQLDEPLNATDFFWMSDPEGGISSTPYYMLRQNVIIVPYGILQEPIFHHEAHDVFKISLLGFVLGHELMHGFGSGGLIYDQRGNYNERGAEIILHSNYSTAISCLNRHETAYLDEREADIAGINLAYGVYFGPGSKFNQTQPEFTNVPLKQLFFLNVAQFFCNDAEPNNFKNHDDDTLRLRQMLINFEGFAETHNCRQDEDNMHPADKCRLW